MQFDHSLLFTADIDEERIKKDGENVKKSEGKTGFRQMLAFAIITVDFTEEKVNSLNHEAEPVPLRARVIPRRPCGTKRWSKRSRADGQRCAVHPDKALAKKIKCVTQILVCSTMQIPR